MPSPGPAPSLVRRLGAVFYDGLLLFAALYLATGVALLATGPEAIAPGGPLNELYLAYLVLVSYLYFGWFWTHGGQTLGMRAWKVRVRRVDGSVVTWPVAARRFAAACLSWLGLGLGFLWPIVDRERRAWHDRLSRTVLERFDP